MNNALPLCRQCGRPSQDRIHWLQGEHLLHAFVGDFDPPASSSSLERLRALATKEAWGMHAHAYWEHRHRGGLVDGHVFVSTLDDDHGFSTCPHPDCACVRAGEGEP